MAGLKREKVAFNRRIRLSNGKTIPLRKKAEAPATVYFGVRFKDGISVFMPRAKNRPKRDLRELRRHALSVRGLPPEAADKPSDQIVDVSEACRNCAREIPGCTGCAFSAAIAAEKAAAEKNAAPKAEAKAAPKDGPGFSDGGKKIA